MEDPYSEGYCFGMNNRALLYSLSKPDKERFISQTAAERFTSSEDCQKFIQGVIDGATRGANR